jgi:hypothetical protein
LAGPDPGWKGQMWRSSHQQAPRCHRWTLHQGQIFILIFETRSSTTLINYYNKLMVKMTYLQFKTIISKINEPKLFLINFVKGRFSGEKHYFRLDTVLWNKIINEKQ